MKCTAPAHNAFHFHTAFVRVGGTEEIPVNIRILAATNKDLKYEVEDGSFRQDLYYRLNVITLHVPPLSERKEDIPLLCQHFLAKFSQSRSKPVERISDEVMNLLVNYEFPGNIRELENIIERAVALAQGTEITLSHLPPDVQQMAFRIKPERPGQFLTLEENEMEYIRWVLQKTENNKSKAAEILGIDRVSLWRKLRRYHIAE